MDVLVYYRRELEYITELAVSPAYIVVRPATDRDTSEVERIARASFAGYQGHYHADPMLKREACDEVYRSWAVRSMSRDVAAEVLVAQHDNGSVAGFATLCIDGTEGIGELFCVAPGFRRQGIYRLLMYEALEWFAAKGLKTMSCSTQCTNTTVQNAWIELGFRSADFRLTFHKWFA